MHTIELESGCEAAPRVFATTHWSVVTAAGASGSEYSQVALETICRAYWFPIYAYVRRKGYGAHEAQDLTQEFFSQLIAKEHLRRADCHKGKFRTFLLSVLDYFLAREWSRIHRLKRGAQFQFVSLDQSSLEERYDLEPTTGETPRGEFERQWALSMLQRAMAALEHECAKAGKEVLFRETKSLLSGERDRGSYTALAKQLAMSEGSLRVAVHRLRQRYGELLRQEVRQTVPGPDDIEDELRHLVRVLSS